MNSNNLQKTALHEQHLKLGAKMLPFAGFDMPIQYAGIKAEVKAVRSKSGLFDVSHMGEFWVKGPECHQFIDFMVSNHFLKSEIGKAVYSPLCREDGTVIDDLIAYKLGKELALICVNASNIEKDWNWFVKNKGNFNIEITDKSDDFALLALQGPDSQAILQELDFDEDILKLPYYGVMQYKHNGNSLIIARTGYTGEDGFEIFCPSSFASELWNSLIEKNVTPCGLGARDVLRVEVCYPLYGHELNDNLTPLDAALKWTVKCDKKFIGSEKLKNLTSNFRLVKLTLNKGIPRQEYPILNSSDKIIGKITSGTMSPTLNLGVGIGLIERSKWPDNKEFKIKIRNNVIDANYIKGAFYKGGHK